MPRLGTDVLIDFIEGDIDRPVVVAQLYTGADTPGQVRTRLATSSAATLRNLGCLIEQAPFQVSGAMNYLHGGSNTPRIGIEIVVENDDLNTTWRLIWRDDRYLDGSIPAVDAQYVFTQPPKMLVESDLNAAIALQQSAKLPMHEGREVRWVLEGK